MKKIVATALRINDAIERFWSGDRMPKDDLKNPLDAQDRPM